MKARMVLVMKKSMYLTAMLIVLIPVAGLGCSSEAIVTVRGMVQDSANQVGIPGATVAAGAYSAMTNAVGEYNLTMPYGRANFVVTAPGYKDQSQQTMIRQERTCFVSFGLVDYFYTAGHSTGLVQGTVANLKSVDPIEEAHLVFTGDGQTYQAVSTHLGAYSIELPSDSPSNAMTYSVHVTAKGYRDYSSSVTVSTGRYNTQNILMRP
jgi:hypothetical protein